MTAVEVYDLVTKGGGNDFARIVEVCEALGPYCLIGGLAVNHYVEPVYTVDADLVLVSGQWSRLPESLEAAGFRTESFEHSLNAQAPRSDLRIQFTTDPRYQDFLPRAEHGIVLGVETMVASLRDVTQGKIWAWSDPKRRFSKRKKDELDLVRLAEAHPELVKSFPPPLAAVLRQP